MPAYRFESALRQVLFAAILSTSFGTAQAYITVGAHGTYPTIQGGVDAAVANLGDEVRVEVKYCNDVHGFQYVCPYKENIVLGSGGSSVTLTLTGGWASDFQSQSGQTHLQGVNGVNVPVIYAAVPGVLYVGRFYIDGAGTSPGTLINGVYANAYDSGIITIADNTISNVAAQTTSSSIYSVGGAGLFATAIQSGYITVTGNTIQSNSAYGTDTGATHGGGAIVETHDSGHIDFVLNTVAGNTASNPNNGGCHGGGLWAAAHDTSTMQLRKNVYSGNGQLACSNGATGDAAEIVATESAVIDVYDETWTNNNVPSDPGVYEVFMQTDGSSRILAQNGLITHGTWGGLFANTLATSNIDISNYTIADNPVLGYRGANFNTRMWNTILWNDGTALELDNTATCMYCLYNSSNPLFVDEPNGNYRLSAGSPAVNSGTSSVIGGLRPIDLDGNPRPFAEIPDIGAFELNDTVFQNGFE